MERIRCKRLLGRSLTRAYYAQAANKTTQVQERINMSVSGCWNQLLVTIGTFAWLFGSVSLAQDQAPAIRPPWTTSRVHGSPIAPEPFRIVPAFPTLRFDKPTSIEELPGMNR